MIELKTLDDSKYGEMSDVAYALSEAIQLFIDDIMTHCELRCINENI